MYNVETSLFAFLFKLQVPRMLWEQKVEYAALSDIGFRRRNNQDSYVSHIATDAAEWTARGHLFLVADGMGGHAVGELASKIAADTIPHTFHKARDLDIEAALKAAIVAANAAINGRGVQNRDFTRMGTTCTTLVLSPRGAVLGHVGDSRGYRIRRQRIEQLTFDHSLQWELLRQGKMSPEEIFLREPRNIITRSLGPEPTVEVDIEGPYEIRAQDVYVLCSDGLSTLVKDEEIGIIGRELAPMEACQMLVDLANLRGGSDNITVVVARVNERPPGMTGAMPVLPEQESSSSFGWGWLAAVAATGIAGVWGYALVLLNKFDDGKLLLGLSLIGFIGMLIAWFKQRGANRNASLPDVTPGTPYRTASAKVTGKFVNELASLENSLQRTAQDEGWSIDWPEHKRAYEAAKAALAARRYSESLRGYAKAIHLLMSGIQMQRKQRDILAKWGPKATAKPDA